MARLSPAEHARLREIRLRSLHDAPDAFWATADEEERFSPEEWQARLSDQSSVTFVAQRDGTDVGLVGGGPHHDDPSDAGLYGMWVAPEARGSGVGTRLIAAVISWARDGGYPSLRLEVADDNDPAIQLYARMGFLPTGATQTMPPPRDHITEHERILHLRR